MRKYSFINYKKTKEKYGHDASRSGNYSRKVIVINCNKCGTESHQPSQQIFTNKSVKEDGEYICKSCATSIHHKGWKASKETIRKMSKAQQRRRQCKK